MSVLPAHVSQSLLAATNDPCVVVARGNFSVVWANDAWREFQTATQSINREEGAAIMGPLAELLASDALDSPPPEGHLVTWCVDGTAAFEAKVAVESFSDEGSQFLAVMVLSPQPALTLPTINNARDRDPLTGLADRNALERHLEKWEQLTEGATNDLAVLFIDLDGFKEVNDGWGHLVGDEVLVAVASRLSHAVRSGDLIARFGGDEFVVIVGGIKNRAELTPVVDRLHHAAQQPVATKRGTIEVSASIGVALASEGTTNLRELIAQADRNMYADKRATD